MKILVINGPNLNLLGQREPHIYGNQSLKNIEDGLFKKYPAIEFDFFQSSSESKIVDYIAKQNDVKINGIIINAASFTHTSIAIRDALLGANTPFIEVHLSNIYKREKFRQHSYLSDCALGVIVGFKGMVYSLAVDALLDHLQS